jgi:hypothetical protein
MTFFPSFDRVLIAPPCRKEANAMNKAKKNPKFMRGYHIDEVAPFLLKWYESYQSLNKFCRSPFPLPRATFQRHVKNSGIANMKERGVPFDDVKANVEQYVDSFCKNKKSCTEIASEGNRYLTDGEEDWL